MGGEAPGARGDRALPRRGEADGLPRRRPRELPRQRRRRRPGDPEEELERARRGAGPLRGARRPPADLPPGQQPRRGRRHPDRRRRDGPRAGAGAGEGEAADRDHRRAGRLARLALRAARGAPRGGPCPPPPPRRLLLRHVPRLRRRLRPVDARGLREDDGRARRDGGPLARRGLPPQRRQAAARQPRGSPRAHRPGGARARALPSPPQRRALRRPPGLPRDRGALPGEPRRPPGAGPPMTAGRKTRRAAGGVPRLRRARFAQLIALAKGKRRALVLTHDNPDPDSIAGGVALAWLLKRVARVDATVAYGGIIGRAENRALVKVLRLPLTPVSRVSFDDFDLVCMVDTQPDQGNHSLPAGVRPDVIIDHHPRRPETARAPFADVGGPIGASSTVIADYVRASGLRLPSRIATALFYGIKADTRDLGRMTTRQDVDAYLWLFPMADKDALRAIEYPRLPASYFRLQHTALERLELWGDVVVVDLGDLYAPDMVAEVAERFHLLEGTRWALAFGRYAGALWFSLRTSDLRANAGRTIRRVIEERGGSAGGHGSMAGARLPVEGLSMAAEARLKTALVRAFLRALRVRVRKPKKLVK